MAVVMMMQAAIHQIADMVAMRHGLVPASGAMDMAGVMIEGVTAYRCTVHWIRVGYVNDMLVDVIAMRMVQMTIVQVVHVITVLHGRMTTAGAVNVRMVPMLRVGAVQWLSPCVTVSCCVRRHDR